MSARSDAVKPSPCTACGKLMDSAAEIGPGAARPKPGDITICFYCHHVMVFADNMTLRDLTDEEIVEVEGEPDIVVAMRALGEFKKQEKR